MATYTIYCNLQELQNIGSDDDYLFHNYGWKHHPAWQHVMMLAFSDDDYHGDACTEAYGVFYELWKLHLPSLTRDWN